MTDPTVSSLVSSVTFLSAVILGGLILAGTVVLLRVTRQDTFRVWNVSVNIRYAWIVFVLFTVAHLYVANLVSDDVDAVTERSAEVQQDAWNQITGGSFFLLHGMHSRTAWVDYTFLWIRLHKLQIQTDDRTKVLHYASGILLLLACTNWHGYKLPLSGSTGGTMGFATPDRRVRRIDKCVGAVRHSLSLLRQILPSFLLSALIVLVNWSAATRWVLALSQLTPSD